jgi:hypothetical protein
MTLLARAFALMAIGCVLVLVEDAARTGWAAAAGAAALLFGLLFAIWAVAARLTKTRKDRTLGHAPELSTLVFPPSSFKVALGTEIAPRPPHRSVRAALPHTAPALSHDAKR